MVWIVVEVVEEDTLDEVGGGGWVRWVGGRVLVFWVRVGVSQTVFQNRTERHRVEEMFLFSEYLQDLQAARRWG